MLLLDTLPMLGNVLMLCFFVFFIFGIVGVQLWAGRLRNRCYLVLPDNISTDGSVDPGPLGRQENTTYLLQFVIRRRHMLLRHPLKMPTKATLISIICISMCSLLPPPQVGGVIFRLPDTSALRHFGTTTVRHQYRMVPKCLETIRHQIFTGAELSGHFGTSAEIPRDTSAPSVKNTYGLLFRQNRPTISTICGDLPILQL